MNYATNLKGIETTSLYNNIKKINYNTDGYLQRVERVQMDYKDLFKQYQHVENTVFLIDPPYLSTDTTTYNSKSYWKLSDYLNVLNCMQNSWYFYFTSEKSQIIELCEWIAEHTDFNNPFENSNKTVIGTQVTSNARYNDIMIWNNE